MSLTDWILCCVVLLFVLFMLSRWTWGLVFRKTYRRFACWIGWHSIEDGFIYDGFDGQSFHATCKYCGNKVMIDSQGNLF